MGGAGAVVEIDETFIGQKEGVEMRRGYAHKNVVLSLIERGGQVRSFHVDSTRKEDIIPIVEANIAKETHVMTDEAEDLPLPWRPFRQARLCGPQCEGMGLSGPRRRQGQHEHG